MRLATYLTPQRFWCHICDANIVDSTKSETGVFICVNGHVWDFSKKEMLGDWPRVVFAICVDCKKDALKKFQNILDGKRD